MTPPVAVDLCSKPEAVEVVINDAIAVDESALKIDIVLFTPDVADVVAIVVVLLQRTHVQRELVLGQTKQLKSLLPF
jgi:hypothetical protein